jgi:hypothetical protein
MCLASFSTDDDDDHEDDRRGHSRRLRAARALARSLAHASVLSAVHESPSP